MLNLVKYPLNDKEKQMEQKSNLVHKRVLLQKVDIRDLEKITKFSQDKLRFL